MPETENQLPQEITNKGAALDIAGQENGYKRFREKYGFEENVEYEEILKTILQEIKHRTIPTTTIDLIKKDKKTVIGERPKTKKELRKDQKRAHPQHSLADAKFYYSAYDNPSMVFSHDKYLDKLFRKYRLYQYDPIDPHYYQWFESFPDENKKTYKKAYKKLSKKKQKKIKQLQKKYKKASISDPLWKQGTIDWIDVYWLDKHKHHYCFDTRECWNLDQVIPYLLYPRLKHMTKYMIGYDSDFKSFKSYKKKVIKPILQALEYQIVFGGVDDHFFIFDWCKANNKTDINGDLSLYLMHKIQYGYHLLAEYLFSFWI